MNLERGWRWSRLGDPFGSAVPVEEREPDVTGLNLPLTQTPNLAPAVELALYYRDVAWVGLALLLIAAAGGFVHLRRRTRSGRVDRTPCRPDPALRARRLLALGLGGLWVLDGLLQMQPGMTTSFLSGLVGPLTAGQPRWLAAILGFGAGLWGIDPIFCNVFTTFMQIVVGVLILIGGEGIVRRIGLWVSIGWGLVVWVLGEALGSTFVGGTWLAGWPGSVALYLAAAVLLLAPPGTWRRGDWLRWFGWGMAMLCLLSALLQAWPPNGYWTPDGLYAYVFGMGQMRQPSLFAAPLLAWAGMLRRQGAVWNGAMTLGLLGLAISWWRWADRPWLWWATIAWQFMTWWLGEDFGVLGGMGTDPNSGAPLILLLVTYVVAQRTLARGKAALEPARVPATVRLAGQRLR